MSDSDTTIGGMTANTLTISYDTNKVTKVEYSFTGVSGSFVEYNAIDSQTGVNSGVVITKTSRIKCLYVRPTIADTEKDIDENCFSSLVGLTFDAYDSDSESWLFKLATDYTNLSLTITTTTRSETTHTLTVKTNPQEIQSNAVIKINGVITSTGEFTKDQYITIECKRSFENGGYLYTLADNNELNFTMPDNDKTVTILYDRKPKKCTVTITTEPEMSNISGFNFTESGEYEYGTTMTLSWDYNGITDSFIYKKNKYEFVRWEYENGSYTNASVDITVTTDMKVVLMFKKTAIEQEQTYYLGDSYQKHYRFKIQYKNAQTDPITLDWYPIVYDYGVNE